MSIDCMNRVWKQSKQKGAQLLLLLAIADCADEDGYAWPQILPLAKKTRMSERHVRRMIDEISESGEILIDKTKKAHRYLITVELTEAQILKIIKSRSLVFEKATPDKMSAIDTGQDVRYGKATPDKIAGITPDKMSAIKTDDTGHLVRSQKSDPPQVVDSLHARGRELILETSIKPSIQEQTSTSAAPPSAVASANPPDSIQNPDPEKSKAQLNGHRKKPPNHSVGQKVFQEVFSRLPKSDFTALFDQAVFDQGEELVKARLTEWRDRGYSATSYKDMLDVIYNDFRDRRAASNGSGKPKQKFSAIDEAVRRLDEIDARKAKRI